MVAGVNGLDGPAVEGLREVLDSILIGLLDIMWLHLITIKEAKACSAAGQHVLGHLSSSLDTLCGHFMRHGNASSASFFYLSLVAELTQTGREALSSTGQEFVRSSALSNKSFCPF